MNANKLPKILRTAFVPCTGEAHSNAFIDNCSCCAPFWGRVLVALDKADIGAEIDYRTVPKDANCLPFGEEFEVTRANVRTGKDHKISLSPAFSQV